MNMLSVALYCSVSTRCASEVLGFTGLGPGVQGVTDAAHEVHAEVQVGGAVGQFLAGKREVHRLTRLTGGTGGPIAQVRALLILVPVHLGEGVAPATDLLHPAFAPPDLLVPVLQLCHPSVPHMLMVGDMQHRCCVPCGLWCVSSRAPWAEYT